MSTDLVMPFRRVNRADVLDVVAPEGNDTGGDILLASNDGNIIVIFVNTGVADATVTVHATAEAGGQALADTTFVVPAGTTAQLGPWPPAIFNDDRGNVRFSDTSGGALAYTALGI